MLSIVCRVLGYLQPRILGMGYDTITGILAGPLAVGLPAMLVVAKAAAMRISLGSKTSEGVLAPILMVGGAIGCLYGDAVMATELHRERVYNPLPLFLQHNGKRAGETVETAK